MKILFVSTSVFPLGTSRYGGIEKLLLDFCEETKNLGHEVSVAAPVGSRLSKGIELIETVDLRFHSGFQAEDIPYYNYCYRLPEFDVVHDFSHQKVAASKHPDGPFLNMLWIDAVYFTELQGGILHPVPQFNNIACSKFQARRFRQVYKRNIRYQPSICVNPKKYIFCSDKGERFVFVQKMSKQKGVLEAIKFCKALGVGLDVVGGKGAPADPEFYMNQVIDECDDEQIVWYGNVHEDVKIKLMQHAKAMLYPIMFTEPHNMACAESMMVGTPVIAFGRGSIPEVIDDGVTGIIARDARAFKRAMKQIDKINIKECHKQAMKKYAREKVVGDYIPLYDSVARGERF